MSLNNNGYNLRSRNIPIQSSLAIEPSEQKVRGRQKRPTTSTSANAPVQKSNRIAEISDPVQLATDIYNILQQNPQIFQSVRQYINSNRPIPQQLSTYVNELPGLIPLLDQWITLSNFGKNQAKSQLTNLLFQCPANNQVSGINLENVDFKEYVEIAAESIESKIPDYVQNGQLLRQFITECDLILPWINRWSDIAFERNVNDPQLAQAEVNSLRDSISQRLSELLQDRLNGANVNVNNINNVIRNQNTISNIPNIPARPPSPRPPPYNEALQQTALQQPIPNVQNFKSNISNNPAKINAAMNQIGQINQANPNMYFNTQYMRPIMNQFTQLVHRDRAGELKTARIENDLLQGMDRLQVSNRDLSQQLQDAHEQLRNCQQQYQNNIQVQAQPVVQTILDPLYLYYAQVRPNDQVGVDEYKFPDYAYFMGLSQIILEGIDQLAQVIGNSISQEVEGINLGGKRLLLEFNEVKSQVLNEFQNDLQHPDNSLYNGVVQFLSKQIGERGLDPTAIANNIFLVNELNDEKQTNNALQQLYQQALISQRTQLLQQNQLKSQTLNDIKSYLDDSDLRLNIIQQIIENVPSLLRVFFIQGVVPTWSNSTEKPSSTQQNRKSVPMQFKRRY